jgi:hypothetical protein
MPNTSATGGYLAPSSTPPTEDIAFERFMQAVIVGITGIVATKVRPRWAETPLPIPEIGVDWSAFGIIGVEADEFPFVLHKSAGQGTDEMQRHETIELMVSFYGPNSQASATLFRDGLYIPQNREELWRAQVALLEVRRLVSVPDLMNNKWRRRYDTPLRLRRCITRVYPVLNLLSAQGSVNTDAGTTQAFTVTEN